MTTTEKLEQHLQNLIRDVSFLDVSSITFLSALYKYCLKIMLQPAATQGGSWFSCFVLRFVFFSSTLKSEPNVKVILFALPLRSAGVVQKALAPIMNLKL